MPQMHVVMQRVTQFTVITIVPDTEVPVIIPPADIVLDCGNISETADPAAMIDSLTWQK